MGVQLRALGDVLLVPPKVALVVSGVVALVPRCCSEHGRTTPLEFGALRKLWPHMVNLVGTSHVYNILYLQ